VTSVAQADVNREGRIRRSGRKFEASRPAGGRPKPEDEFLGDQMTGVSRTRIRDVAAEADRERAIQGDADRGPCRDGCVLTVTQFQVADLRLAEADPPPELALCQPSSQSR
jgi:hypothetical protein